MRAMTLYRRGDRATIFLEGEIDLATAPAVDAAVRGCLRQGFISIDIDLARIGFCDASGLNVFLAASRSAAASGGRLRLHRSTPAVRRVFDITGTDFLLHTPRSVSLSCSGGNLPLLHGPERPVASGDQ